MTFKNKEAWEKAVETNKDSYALAIISYSEKWADLMEEEIAKGLTVYDCASETSHTADTDGITGFMFGLAARLLCKVWKYGEDLRKWLNQKCGHGGEGIVNPAIMVHR